MPNSDAPAATASRITAGMEIHGSALDDGPEEGSLDQLHGRHGSQNRESRLPASVRDGDQHGDEAGDDR
jgi:hypothetical protein